MQTLFALSSQSLTLTERVDQVASTIDIPIETLRQLNPQYRLDIIPAATKSYPLTLPIRDLSHYIASEADIKNKDSIYLKEYIDPRKVDSIRVAENTSKSITHTVRSGETLGGIARKYGVSTRQIMQWNNLKNANKLRIGQRLVLVIPPRATTQPPPGKNVHVVRRGETLFSIAKKYGTSVSKIRIINNLRTTRISIGQRLKIR